MKQPCAIDGCRKKATEAVDGNAAHNLCVGHALKWDKDEDARQTLLADIYVAAPAVSDDDAWNEHFSQWAGGQR